MTTADSRPLAEIVTAFSLENPADVNQHPTCERLGVPCLSPRTLPDGGIMGAVGIFPVDRAGFVGELSVYSNPWHAYSGDCPPVGHVVPQSCPALQGDRVGSALAGVRVRTPLLGRRTHDVRLFAQLMAGVEWSDVVPGHHILQPGIGLDHYLWNSTALVHIEYDYRFAANSGGRNFSTGRFVFGLGVPIGWL